MRLSGLRGAPQRDRGSCDCDPDCKYVGDFLKLLETMLPLTRDCARQFGWELSYPQTTSARGKYVEKLTTAGKSLAPGSWLISDAGA